MSLPDETEAGHYFLVPSSRTMRLCQVHHGHAGRKWLTGSLPENSV